MASSKIKRMDIAPTLKSPTLSPTVECVSCTGTITSAISFFDKGTYIVISGRVMIRDYARTSGNPGVIYTLPSGITVSEEVNVITSGIVINNMTIKPETPTIGAHANSGDVSIRSTETYENMNGGTNFALCVPPICIPINRT